MKIPPRTRVLNGSQQRASILKFAPKTGVGGKPGVRAKAKAARTMGYKELKAALAGCGLTPYDVLA